MTTASDTGNPPRPLPPRLRVGDGIPVFSLPNTSGVSVSSTVLLEHGPLIITFYRGIWCPYCRSDLMALMNATFEVQSRGGSLAAIARETAPNSNRRFQQQHRVDFPILNDATAAVARSFGIGWTEAYLQSLYDQFVADRTGIRRSQVGSSRCRHVTSSRGTARSPMSTSTPTIGWHPNWLRQWQRYVAFRRKSARKREFRYQWIRLRRQHPVKPR
jgi:peroxiredoxin